jgi:hypothetical protein
MNKNTFGRRRILELGAGAAGSMLLPRWGSRGLGLFPEAQAQAQPLETPALLLVYFYGGFSALHTSADSYLSKGTFGVTSSNITSVGSGIFADKTTFGSLPASVLSKMAVIGCNHGLAAHSVQSVLVHDANGQSCPLALASAMGGTGSIKCPQIGVDGVAGAYREPAVGGVSFQRITDVGSTLAALGGTSSGPVDPTLPDRTIAAKGLTASQAMSKQRLTQNPTSLANISNGYGPSIAALEAPPQSFSYPATAAAYGLAPGVTAVTTFASKLAAAEVMIQAGANVCVIEDVSKTNPIAANLGWDVHGDPQGVAVRSQMGPNMAAIGTWLTRSLAMTGRNVVTVFMGDFAEAPPNAGHSPNLSAAVFGKHCIQGTTGKVDASSLLPTGSPGVAGLYAYLTAALKLATQPFGANPHGLVG